MKCHVCHKEMVEDKYVMKDKDGNKSKWYYCEHCCKIREVKYEQSEHE